jgi:hypothetical protein
MYIRKTTDEYQIHGYYAHGWEEVTSEETLKAAKACMRLYQANESGTAFKIVKRRVKK